MAKMTNNKPTRADNKNKGGKPKDEDDEHGSKGSVLDALAALDEEGFGDVDAKEGFSDVDPGKYQVVITSALIGKSKDREVDGVMKPGRTQITFEMTILSDGAMKGRKLWKRDGIDSEESIGWFKGGMARLGLETPKKAVDLPDFLTDEVVDTYAMISVRHKKDEKSESGTRVNTYFDKALDEDELDNKPTDLDDDSEAEAQEAEEAPPEKEEKSSAGKRGDKKPKAEAEEPEEPEDDASDGDDEGEGEAEAEEDPDEDKGATEAAKVEVKFDDKACKPLKKKIEAACKAADFDPSDYSSTVDLMCDTAEYLGVSGMFKDPSTLLTAMVKAQPKK